MALGSPLIFTEVSGKGVQATADTADLIDATFYQTAKPYRRAWPALLRQEISIVAAISSLTRRAFPPLRNSAPQFPDPGS